MDIKKTFIRLTNYTCPHGEESQYLRFLPKGLMEDEFGNYFYQIGESKTVFACHLDTVSQKRVRVNHVYDGKFIKTDGKSILGADDKAGLTVLLYMIHNRVPGLYYFFIGEEVGCVGSKKASKKTNYFSKFDRIISFDRRDTHSVITYQSSTRCCSDRFADALVKQYNDNGMNMRKDDTGVYTDSAEFTGVIQECTNISVGYYSEHTFNERQDIEHLNKLCQASILVDWESLPSTRNKHIKEYKTYNHGYGSEYCEYFGQEYGQWPQSQSVINTGLFADRNRSRYNTPTWPKGGSKKKDDRFTDFHNDSLNDEFMEEDDNYIPRSFVDDGDGLKVYDKLFDKRSIGWFDNIKSKYLDDRLSDEEILTIKDQVLDMNIASDRALAKELDELINAKNYNNFK